MKESQIILGIDPGTLVMGYGIIAVNKSKVSLVEMGVLQLSKYDDHSERLMLIYKKVEGLIKSFSPDSLAIEAPFYGKNVQSMLKLGRAQGVAIAAGMGAGLHATEYAPRKVKQSITGNGNATKEQVWNLLRSILCITEDNIAFLDAADAVGVALCHHYQRNAVEITNNNMPLKKPKKNNSWASFIAQNPERIK